MTDCSAACTLSACPEEREGWELFSYILSFRFSTVFFMSAGSAFSSLMSHRMAFWPWSSSSKSYFCVGPVFSSTSPHNKNLSIKKQLQAMPFGARTTMPGQLLGNVQKWQLTSSTKNSFLLVLWHCQVRHAHSSCSREVSLLYARLLMTSRRVVR